MDDVSRTCRLQVLDELPERSLVLKNQKPRLIEEEQARPEEPAKPTSVLRIVALLELDVRVNGFQDVPSRGSGFCLSIPKATSRQAIFCFSTNRLVA